MHDQAILLCAALFPPRHSRDTVVENVNVLTVPPPPAPLPLPGGADGGVRRAPRRRALDEGRRQPLCTVIVCPIGILNTNENVARLNGRATLVQASACSTPRPAPSPSCPPSGPARGVHVPSAFPTVNRFSSALLYGRAGRSTAENGGFRPGQSFGDAPVRSRARPCPVK